ncbi:MAG: RibD family protein [Anaerolineales bacterium]|nr:RibD family protein [Anaerolineales bacterium]
MTLPKVILHMGLSVDGRDDWSAAPGSPYYELVGRFQADIDLSGSKTMASAFLPDNPQEAFADVYDFWMNMPTRPKLAIVDSKGQIDRYHLIKKQPWWQDVITLCSAATPKSHLAYLEEQGVEYILAGEDQVDLAAALQVLNERYGVKVVRVDSGGILNGVLLRAGLVDEVNVVIGPELVGGSSPRSLFVAPDLTSAEGVIPLQLTHVEEFKGGFVWLRYTIDKSLEHSNQT